MVLHDFKGILYIHFWSAYVHTQQPTGAGAKGGGGNTAQERWVAFCLHTYALNELSVDQRG